VNPCLLLHEILQFPSKHHLAVHLLLPIRLLHRPPHLRTVQGFPLPYLLLPDPLQGRNYSEQIRGVPVVEGYKLPLLCFAFGDRQEDYLVAFVFFIAFYLGSDHDGVLLGMFLARGWGYF
jgi:hypothetical protein